ncbi:MAG: hypothetical protein IT158_30045 [Bryobacterales bacterium]|nr:hypothetical protein [Bryobacterales bacterium]
MNIRVQIGELVIEGAGLNAAARVRLQAAVERELARLLTRGGLNPELGGALPSVAGGSLDAAPGASPAQLGRSIAQAIYRGIGR